MHTVLQRRKDRNMKIIELTKRLETVLPPASSKLQSNNSKNAEAIVLLRKAIQLLQES